MRAAPLPPPPDAWDRAAAWLLTHGALPALALLTIGMGLLYVHLFTGEVAGDDLTFHMAESARIADCLRTGDFDFWNPSANGGYASLYYYQAVPQLISALPAAVFGHHLFFFQLSVFLPLVLAPAAAYRGMRILGASPWQAAIAAFAIGLANGESRWGAGNAGTFVVGLYTQTWALAAFPLALGHAVRWATESRSLAPAIAWGTFVTMCHPFAGVSLAFALIMGIAANLALHATDWLLLAIAGSWHPDPTRNSFSAFCAGIVERWRDPPERRWLEELLRIVILGACFAIAWMPIWLPLLTDYAGFGGFPHRVADEVGPGFTTLGKWYAYGALLDFGRPVVLTWTLPAVLLFARSRYLRWLWAPALMYALWLGAGPHIAKTDDDLIPPVRFLGAMQVVLAMAIGAGYVWLCKQLWDAPDGSPISRAGRALFLALLAIGAGVVIVLAFVTPFGDKLVPVFRLAIDLAPSTVRIAFAVLVVLGAVLAGALLWIGLRSQYGVRTALAAVSAALFVLTTMQGARALSVRVNTLPDYPSSHGNELHAITFLLQGQPPGRKQVGVGAENHWWNLLSWQYGRRPSLLQMGGGGLQASPNYDFLWSARDFKKTAWLYDAPILVYQHTNSNTKTMPAGDTLFQTKNYRAIRLPAPGLVSPVEVTGTLPADRKAAHAAAIEWLKTDQPLEDRVKAYAGNNGLATPPAGRVTRAVRQDSPGDAPDIVAEVDASAPTTFMIRESWHPRWLAFIDGAPAPLRRVTPDFPALDVPAGHHVLTLRFARPWWLHASWLVWLIVPLAAWWLTRRVRSSPATSAA